MKNRALYKLGLTVSSARPLIPPFAGVAEEPKTLAKAPFTPGLPSERLSTENILSTDTAALS